MRFLTILLAATAALAQVPMPPPLVPGTPAPKPAARPAAGRNGARASAAAPYKDLKYPAARSPQLPAVQRFQLPNGVKVLLAENHETPVIHGLAMVRTGSVLDPPGREGLAGLTGALLRGGGTRDRTPEQLDSELERLGATVDSNIGETMGSVTFFSLKASLAPALAIFRDVLTTPAFRADRLDLAKSGIYNLMARRNDDPRQLLRREFQALLYGKDSPLSRRPEYASISVIQRADVDRFYRRYYFPANTVLVFSGDFDGEAMKAALERLFAEWKSEQQQPATEFPKPAAEGPAGAFLAFKPDAGQSYIAFGRPGVTYRDKDAAALEVASAIVSGPQGRLKRAGGPAADIAKDIRTEAMPGMDVPGPIAFMGSMLPGGTGEGVSAVVAELQKLRAAGPTEDELRAARDTVWQRACQGLDNPAKAAFAVAAAEYYGYPTDYRQQYLKAVAAVTRADIVRVAKERLDPARFTLAVVSNLRALVDPRTGTAAAPIDLTVPARPAASPSAATGSAQEAKKLLERAQQAAGGAEKLAAVKDMTAKTLHILTDGGKDEEFDQWVAPSMLREDGTSSRFGRLIRFTDGEGGWMSNGYNSAVLNQTGLGQLVGEALRHPISLLLSDRVPGRALGLVDDRTIEITHGQSSVQVAFDAATGLPSELRYEVATERQPILIHETWSDYRDVNGIKLPFHVVTAQNGARYAEGDVTEIKLNQGLKPEVLRKRP